MAHLSDVVVMKVSNTVLKHKHATRNTLARNRMLARLTETAKQGAQRMTIPSSCGCDAMLEPTISRSPSRTCSVFSMIGMH